MSSDNPCDRYSTEVNACLGLCWEGTVTQPGWSAPPPHPPGPPPPAPPPVRGKRSWWRATGVLIGAGAIVGLLVGVAAAGGAKTKTTRTSVAGPTTHETVTVTATAIATVTTTPIVKKVVATHTATVRITYTPPPPKQYGEGTYVVGSDIQPGMYKTSGGGNCYWARLSSLDTSDIIDNSISSGPQTIQVLSSDKALEVSGECTFGRAG